MSRYEAAAAYLAEVEQLTALLETCREGYMELERRHKWLRAQNEDVLTEVAELRQETHRLKRLLVEHHNVSALHGTMVGDKCQICARIS